MWCLVAGAAAFLPPYLCLLGYAWKYGCEGGRCRAYRKELEKVQARVKKEIEKEIQTYRGLADKIGEVHRNPEKTKNL